MIWRHKIVDHGRVNRHGGGAPPRLSGEQQQLLKERVLTGADLERDGIVACRILDIRALAARRLAMWRGCRPVRHLNSVIFMTYVARCLVPALKDGDIVVMDTLKPHKAKGVREAIEAVGAKLVYLPPYSPDLNPIELLFVKFKALLRKAAGRSIESLWTRIGKPRDEFASQKCG